MNVIKTKTTASGAVFADAIIVGAGQAGLAMSRALTERGVEHLLLERGVVGQSWRAERWDSLRLLTPNWANGLPGAPYRGPDPDGFMPVSELVARLDRYAETLRAPVISQTAVRRVGADGRDEGYVVETDQGPFACRSLVIATGACAKPRSPKIAAAAPSGLRQTTPLAYKRPSDLPEGRALVVGASASGVQLAREIHASGRPVTLAVGGHLRLPRHYRGRDIEWWLDAIGALDLGLDAVDDIERARRAPSPQLIGGPDPVDLNALQADGVEIVGRLADIRNDDALFSGGLANACASADLKMNRLLDAVDLWIAEHGLDAEFPPTARPEPTRPPAAPRLRRRLGGGEIESLLWATGYTPDFSWLDLPVFDRRGRLRHEGGVVGAPGVATPRLYALGLPFLRRRRSHQLSGVGDDARALAEHLRAALDGRRAA